MVSQKVQFANTHTFDRVDEDAILVEAQTQMDFVLLGGVVGN